MNMIRGKIFFILIAALFIGSSFVPKTYSENPVRGTTLYVGGSGLGNYTSIQDAIDDCISGGTVYVYDDSSPYFENIIFNNPVTLIGENKETTVIDGNNGSYCLNIISDGNTISGFTIENCNDSDGSAIIIDAAYTTIVDNIIKNNDYYGIYITSSSSNTLIYHNDFINNNEHAYDGSDSSIWDNGYPSGGNFWDDLTTPDNNHSKFQNLTGFDLIVDESHTINGVNNNDRWPWAIQDGWDYPFFIPSLILVQFNDNVSDIEIQNTIDNYGTTVEEHLNFINVYVLSINVTNQSEFDTMYLFDNDSFIKWANVYTYDFDENHLTEPNDECYPKQWHLNNVGNNPGVPTGLIDADIDAPQAWEHITDCRQDIFGDDFVIAIIDSGVDLHHPDIIGNLWVNPSEVAGNMALNGIDDDGDGLIDILDPNLDGDQDPLSDDDDGNGIIDDIHGADFSDAANPDGSPDDDNGHGTHCAGIICAQGNNRIGVSGVCWRAQLMILKGDIVQSINYILDKKAEGININVISFSRGISTDYYVNHGSTVANANNLLQNHILPFYQNLIDQLDNAGILFVCSAGNDGKDADAPNYIHLPHSAPNPNIIAVGASDNQDKMSSFSNWGETSVDLISPGENILSLALHGLYVYNDSDDSNTVTHADQRLTRIPAVFPPGSTVEAGDGDINFFLRAFNNNEKHVSSDNVYDNGEHIYRDNDNENNVTAGDLRLSPIYINGLLRFQQNTIVINTDADNGTDIINFQANERHRDNKGNAFIYDSGEYIYRDVDNNGWVSIGDIRLTQVRSFRSASTSVSASHSDVGDCLHSFDAVEKHDETIHANNRYDPGETVYRDNHNPADNIVSIGDQRLTSLDDAHVAGSFVRAGDPDIGRVLVPFLDSEKYSLVRYMSGTSMATPVVTGEVAHFWCHYPWLSHIEVKDWILRKVDPRKTIMNTVVSGKWNDGRLRMLSGFDFGDAPDPYTVNGQYPTVLWDELSHGASHEDMGEEWLGWDTSPEYDANVFWPWDVDAALGTPNLLPARIPNDPHPSYNSSPIPNLDWYDDGVSLPKIVFKGGTYEIKFNIRTENPFIHDVDDGRYDEYRLPVRDEKKIYINAYFDWNNDGDWDDGGEHLIKCPDKQCTWWGGPWMTCCYGIFWHLPFDNAYRKTTFTVPDNASDIIWVRVRLDYGENVGRDPWPRYDSTHPFDAVGEILSNTYSHAQFGEVEDYLMYSAIKLKIIGYPEYINNDISYVTSETPFELIDIPEEFTPLIFNYYRLWYNDEWTDWIEYAENEMFYLIDEGDHQIEFYGTSSEIKTVLNESFENGDDLWTINNPEDYGNSWEWSNVTPDWADPTIKKPFMIINDKNSELPTTASLTSPLLSCDQLTNSILSFKGQFSAVGQEKVYVNISTDYGENWTNVLLITQDVPSLSNSWSIDVTDVVGDSMFLVQFTYSDENELGNGMIISEFQVNGELMTYSPTYYNYHIVDNSPPILSNIIDLPLTKTIQDPVTISCDVTDQYCGVNTVMCNISGPADFGQINISITDSNYSYTSIFTIPGTYTYFIWANDSLLHNITSDTFTFQVLAPPTANFTYYPSTPMIYEPVQFIDTSTDIDGTIVNWTWDFGDGTFSYEHNPIHAYTQSMDYLVCLTVLDNDGIEDTQCYPLTTILIDAGIIDSNIHNGDTRYIGDDSLSCTITNYGEITVDVTVHFLLEIENSSMPSGWEEVITIDNGPYELDPDAWIESFFDVSYDREGEYRGTFDLIISYQGEPIENDNDPSNNMYQAIFDVTLMPVVMTDIDDGDWNWSVLYTDTIYMYINFTQYDGNPLQNQAEVPKTVYLEYLKNEQWKNLSNSTLKDPNDQNTTLNFTITTGPNGTLNETPELWPLRFRFEGDMRYAPETEQGILRIMNNPPVANFSILPLSPTTEDIIQCNDLSTDIEGNITEWYWDFGDGNTSSDQHPNHQYTQPTFYTICLTVTDSYGDNDTICLDILVTGIDINQSVFNRGFPIRHAIDGDWGAGQNFIPTLSTITKCEIYLRKFGNPEFDLVVELREDSVNGPVLDTLTFSPTEIPSTWTWIDLDFADTIAIPETDYFIKCPPAPSGITTSFGYEWGYAFGNQYDNGAFWFTRDGGNLWRDLPTMYEFVFETYGYD